MRTHDFTATLQFGTVAAVDAAKHAVRVTVPTLDDIQTDWLPVVSLGTGGNQFYALPDVGALAVCLLDARGEGGVCLGVIYNEQDGTPATDANMWLRKFSNGTVISHNRADGQVTVDTPGKVVIKAAAKVEIQSPETEITGNATVNSMLTYTAGLTPPTAAGAIPPASKAPCASTAKSSSMVSHSPVTSTLATPAAPPAACRLADF